jgi:hypothetical protein
MYLSACRPENQPLKHRLNHERYVFMYLTLPMGPLGPLKGVIFLQMIRLNICHGSQLHTLANVAEWLDGRLT